MIELLTALATLALTAGQWWLSSAPARRARRRRRANRRCHDAVAGRDVDAVRRLLRRLRAESFPP